MSRVTTSLINYPNFLDFPTFSPMNNFMRNYQILQNQGKTERKYITYEPNEINEKAPADIDVADLVCGIPQVQAIYCINLESCPQRKKHMEKQFSKYNFSGRFIKAIHPGHRVFKKRYHNSKWVDQSWDKSRCFCVNDCDHRVRKLRSTEIAIALSHFSVYEEIGKNKDSWSLVCEDDLVFNENFCDIINRVIPKSMWKTEEPCIIFCGGSKDNHRMEITDVREFSYKSMPNGCYSNYCYILNYEAAKLFHRKFFPINRPEDSFKRYWIGKGRVKAYKIKPSIVGELSSGTNFNSVYNRLSQHKPPPKLTMSKSVVSPSPEEEFTKEHLERKRKRAKRVITYSRKKTAQIKVYKK